MITRRTTSGFTICLGLLILVLALSSCGGGDSEPTVESNPSPVSSEPQGDTINTQEPEFDTSMVQVAELPKDFPANFPIPAGAQVTSNLDLAGEDDFRVFIAILLPMEDVLAYYEHELPANGWTIDEQTETNRKTEMTISSGQYNGELLFAGAETGVALDVHLTPSGTGESLPELPGDLGDSASLGEGGGSFPADFPLPISYTSIGLPDRAQSEGFQLAYTATGMAEMVMVELNLAVMEAGWEIGESTIDAASGVYLIPFVNPASGFQGFASILRDGSAYGLPTGGVLILLAPGTP